jgi:hypothetical protein
VFGRSKPAKTQKQQMMDELVESYGHLRQAAGHLAGGTAEVVTPRYDQARNVAVKGWTSTKGAFQPMVDQMRLGAANARAEFEQEQKKRNRWPVLVGLLAAGAAVGATGAMIARRRRAAAEWEEYEPMPPIGETPHVTERKSAAEKVTAGAASVAESVSTTAGKVAESLHGRSSSTAPSPSSGPSTSSSSDPTSSSGPTSSSDPTSSSGPTSTTSSPASTSSAASTPASEKAADKPSGSSNRRSTS